MISYVLYYSMAICSYFSSFGSKLQNLKPVSHQKILHNSPVVSYRTRIQEPLRKGMLFATVRMTLLLFAVSWLADSSTMVHGQSFFRWVFDDLMILMNSDDFDLIPFCKVPVSFQPYRCSKRFFDDRRVFIFSGTCNA